MARTQTMIQLTDELIGLLDAEATRRGASRSAIVREAVEAYLAGGREAAVTSAIVDGYTRIPPVTPDEWGDLEAQLDRASGEVLQRLDAEEKRSGHEPW